MTKRDDGGPVSADRIQIAAGGGILARRASALLFVPETGTGADELLAAFADADDVTVADMVTDAATLAAFDIGPFVLVDWAEELHVVALGTVEVRTDHASLPMLSGAGSGSWVERRLRLDTTPITVATGATAAPSTDLQLGRVSAAGFTATFSRARTPRPNAESVNESVSVTERDPQPATPFRPDAVAPPVEPSPPTAPPAAPPAAPPTAPPTGVTAHAAADPTGPIATDRLAALRAAMRAPNGPDTATSTATPTPTRTPTRTPAEPAPVVGATEVPAPSEHLAAAPAPPAPIDDEVTLAPDDPPIERPAAVPTVLSDDHDLDQAPFVPARRCGRGHLNPPHVGACRTCGDLLDATAPTEQVRQPPLATLDLDDDVLPIDRSLVLGRKPDLGAAQATDRARLVVLADDASVSRTHLRIDVEDWTLTVTDCGSRSGTAIVARPGEEPRILEPWVAHELPIGARLFLGGPTSVVVRPAGGR